MSSTTPDLQALFAQFVAAQQNQQALPVNPAPPSLQPLVQPAYRCGLADTQRAKGNLCGKSHCGGCAPYRKAPTGGVPKEVMEHHYPGFQPMPTVAPAAPTESAYISRTEHEITIARAVRESYETRRGDRRDLFIGAALQAAVRVCTDEHRQLDVERAAALSIELADAVLKADDGKDDK